MNALLDAMSHAVLGWVKPDLDETLSQARREIELFVEEPADTSRMFSCADYLHQVQGTLRMLELYAPAMVAEEMERLAKAMQINGVDDHEEACAVLMRGTLLLPDYLERLQNGHRDIPIVLLPLLNEIRTARGEPRLNENVLFAFDPDVRNATEAELNHARSSLAGCNRQLLDTVSNAVKEELLRVKEALDLYLRIGGDITDLKTQIVELSSVADTLAMMGLAVARGLVLKQRDALLSLVESGQQADEALLLDIAGALLHVDASLDNQVASLGSHADEDSGLANIETQRTLDVLVHETISNFTAARECFIAFIESNWDQTRLAKVPGLLSEVGGALSMLELPQAATYLEGIRLYIEYELISKRRVPSARQLDTLADTMASLEYYLEALRERRPGRDDILEITRNSLEALSYWPCPTHEVDSIDTQQSTDILTLPALVATAIPPEEVPSEFAVVEDEIPVKSPELLEPAPELLEPESAQVPDLSLQEPASLVVNEREEVVQVDALDLFVESTPDMVPPQHGEAIALSPLQNNDEISTQSIPVSAPPLLSGGFNDGAGVIIDDDIRDVFLEEFDDELGNLRRLLTVCRETPDNQDSVRQIRRVFHTLKGSGRLVGALTLGDFAWKIEVMLNRVLDGSRSASPAVVALLELACEVVLPEINAALHGQASINADLEAIQGVIDLVASGEDAFYASPDSATGESYIPKMPSQLMDTGTSVSLDRVLLEILETEVSTHLDTINAWLNTAANQPHSVEEPLLRAIHTLNGAFSMTEVPEITEVIQCAEVYMKRLLAMHKQVSVEGVAVLSATATAIADTMTALRSESPRIPSFASLVASLSELIASIPEGQLQLQHVESMQDVLLSSRILADVYDASVNPGEFDVSSAEIEPIASTVDTSSHEVVHQYDDVAVSTLDTVEIDSDRLVSGNPQVFSQAPAEGLELIDFDQTALELVDIFTEESNDLLDHCDNLLAKLHEAPQDREFLISLQRNLHTLKGGARMAGINAIGDLGHSIESMLEAAMADNTSLSRDDMRLLEHSFDHLHQMLTHARQHRVVVMPSHLIEMLKARTQGVAHDGTSDFSTCAAPALVADVSSAQDTVIPSATTDKETQDIQDTVVVDSIVYEPVTLLPPLSSPIPLEGQGKDSLLEHLVQEQVRVRADLLDRLVNHAGEVAIYRSQLEQRLSAFRNAMSELGRTNTRLRDQLRRLDLETEAQIVARYQREQHFVTRDFDPLELDRFSTLQQLSRALNESAADLNGLQGVLEEIARQYNGLLQQQSRVSSELQDGLMRARMVPFNSIVPRLRRVVRQAEADTSKQVHLVLEGTHGELDRNVLDRMVAPLEHMLRNAVAHGLELPEHRRAAGKADEGMITIQLQREGSEIVLKVADDGGGLDRDAIQRRAKQCGLITSDVDLSDVELYALIFTSGFTTYDEVSQFAGRGVGMDVVRSEVSQLGGSVNIDSVPGHGVTFTLRLPQTLAVTQAVFVRIGESTFAIPVASISGIGRIARGRYKANRDSYHYDGEGYALHDLGLLIGQSAVHPDRQEQVPLLLVRAGDLRVAVAVEEILGNHEIVVKPVGLQIASVPGIYGATITGDGSVVVILDLAPLVRRYLSQPIRLDVEEAPVTQTKMPLIMVVDDSLTMRKVTSRVLERHNLSVSLARDGVEALELLEQRIPDLMLLDIEMPRMDGYELVTAMRADDRFKAIPILMVTSRSGDKHRQRAFEIGVQRYLGKPYQELDLMRNVYDLLGDVCVRES
ncbi:MAG TPA: Hpt domain-containing protein [Xylella sp.]